MAAVVCVALAASLAGIGNDFAQDDAYLIRDNAVVHRLGDWWTIVTSPFWPAPYSPDLYRPLTSLLLGFEYVLGHGSPAAFRLVSYLLYAATSAGVFLLGIRLLPRNLALAAALLFAVHPVHVEAVALGAGQAELLVGLCAVLMAIRYLDARRAARLGRREWLLLGALYLAAALSKENGLVLPGLLLAIELILISGPARARVRTLAPGYLFLAAIAAAVLLARHAVLGEVAGSFTAEALQGQSLAGRALTMLQVVPQWARLLIWPLHLRLDYSPQEMVASTGFGVREAAGLMLLIGVVAAAWIARRRAPVFSFGVAWTAVALLPVSNLLIPTGILLAERTLFFPSIGFVLALAGAVGALLPAGSPAAAHWGRELALGCAFLVAAGLWRSVERQRVWRNEAFLAVRSVQDAPRSFRTQRAYGDVLFGLGQRKLALEAYDRAIALAPEGNAWRVRNDLARSFRLLGETAAEAEQLRASLSEVPEQSDTRGYLIAALLAQGQYAAAATQADTAVLRGDKPEVFQNLRALADSAARAAAPPGSIRIQIVTGESRRATAPP